VKPESSESDNDQTKIQVVESEVKLVNGETVETPKQEEFKLEDKIQVKQEDSI